MLQSRIAREALVSYPRYEGATPLTRRRLVLPEVRKSTAFGTGFLFSCPRYEGPHPLVLPKV
jgi:hypothetical protein